MDMNHFEESILRLITKTSTVLPNDVRAAVNHAKEIELIGSSSALGLDVITTNIDLAAEKVQPVCQDTGMLNFKILVPIKQSQIEIEKAIINAVKKATEAGILRSNSVDPITGLNAGKNIGPGMPIIKFRQWEEDYIDVKLILKGGGCENRNAQYTLPTEIEGLGRAGRDLDGIRKCLMHAIYNAQGHGCSVGIIGVGIGGDRASGYELAKDQLFRELHDKNEVQALANLEAYVLENANKLGIGTMGFGGESTLLGCKVGVANRIPASFFVSVAYNCWALRRHGLKINATTGKVIAWHYENVSKTNFTKMKKQAKFVELKAPVTEEEIRKLKVGDVVKISGRLFTGRDAIHKYLADNDSPIDLNNQIIYHCGPVMVKDDNGKWQVKAAGPTTSIREELYQGKVMKKFGIRAAIGKGGMASNTLKALSEHGGVYLNAIGGAAQHYADCIKSVDGVDFLEFGTPEAMWHLEVKDFVAIVTMDSHGNSLHNEVKKTSFEQLKQFEGKVFV